MAEVSGPFESSGDGLEESDWLELEDIIFPNSGYVKGYANELAVTQTAPNPGMSVDVATGAAVIKSSRYRNKAVKTVTIDAAHSTEDRYDLVVVKRTLAAPASTITVTTHKGTNAAAGTAVPPDPTDDATTKEIVLAEVFVEHGTSAITTAMITDKRDSTDCGAYAPEFGAFSIDPATGNLVCGSKQLTAVADPTSAQHAGTKNYIDGLTYLPDPTGHTGQALGTPDGSTFDFITLQKFDHIQEATGSHGIVVDHQLKSNGNSTTGTVSAHSSTVTGQTSVLVLRAGVYNVRWKAIYDTTGKTLTLYKNSGASWTTISGGAGVNTWSVGSDLTVAADDVILLQHDLTAGYGAIVEFRNADGNWMAV